jgi:aldehyde dehydrogenase (NAD+)
VLPPTTFLSPGHSKINSSKHWRPRKSLNYAFTNKHSNRVFTTSHKSFYPDNGGAAASDAYSRIVSLQAYKRIKGLLDGTNGSVVFGGETDEATKFIAPTLVRDVKPDDSLMSEFVISSTLLNLQANDILSREIFGPLLPIVPVEDLDEAIAFINAR